MATAPPAPFVPVNLVWGGLTIPPASTLNGTAAKNRNIAAAGSRSAVPLAYGEDRLGALILNVLPAATGSTLLLVQCLWGFACDSVQDVLLNDAALPTGSTSTHYTGTQTAVSPALVAGFADLDISYGDKLTGYAYSVIAIPIRSFDGQLNITARVRGRKCYDPRKDSTAGGSGAHRLATPTTWEWTDNPALACADFLASSLYGLKRTVNWATVSAAAAACDAMIGSPAEKRRTVGVSFITAGAAADIAETLRAYAGCFLLPGQAGISLLADADASPVAAYDHADGEIAALSDLTKKDLGNIPTAVEILYTDARTTPWREASATAQVTGAGTTKPWRLSQVRLPGVQRYSQAYREAVERLNKLNLCDLSCTLEVFDTGLRHEVGDIVTVTHPVGLSAKAMRVNGVEMPGPGRWRLSLVEHDAAAYSSAVVTAPSTQDTSFASPAGPPAAPTGLATAFEPFGVRLTCNRNAEPDVVGYEWRAGTTWAAAAVLDKLGGTSYLWAVQTSGTFTVWVAAVDADGNVSTPASRALTVTSGTTTALTASIKGPDLQLDYAATAGSFAIAGYEVRSGSSFGSAAVVGLFQVTRHTRRVDWGGFLRWWVVPVDVRGNYGTQRSVDVTITAPGGVTARRSEVVDNNVLLYWAAPDTGSLPVDRYEVRKGSTWAGGAVVGSNGNSTFAGIFEQASGAYTYWVAAFDSAGNQGAPLSIVATVAQPPDYVLRQTWVSTFSGTKTNLYLEDGALIGPVNTSQTWATHYTANSWDTPQDQVDATFPIYAEPSLTSGSYQQDFDYGTILSAANLTVTLGTTLIDGAVPVTCQISYRASTGDGWTPGPAGFNVLGTDVRYVRVLISLACTAGANLISIDSLTLKLANKLRTDSGSGTAVSTDSGGTTVNFNIDFIDADTPLIQPNGTTAVIGMCDFADTAYPTTFKVLLFDRATGARVSGPFSWTARGY